MWILTNRFEPASKPRFKYRRLDADTDFAATALSDFDRNSTRGKPLFNLRHEIGRARACDAGHMRFLKDAVDCTGKLANSAVSLSLVATASRVVVVACWRKETVSARPRAINCSSAVNE